MESPSALPRAQDVEGQQVTVEEKIHDQLPPVILLPRRPAYPLPLLAPPPAPDPVPPALVRVRGALRRRRSTGRDGARRQSPIPRLPPLLRACDETTVGVVAAFGDEEAQGDTTCGGVGAPQCNHSDDCQIRCSCGRWAGLVVALIGLWELLLVNPLVCSLLDLWQPPCLRPGTYRDVYLHIVLGCLPPYRFYPRKIKHTPQF
ncbi:hypothetical protein VPH35_025863 [Triticum aestivum]